MFINFTANSRWHLSFKTHSSDFLFLLFSQSSHESSQRHLFLTEVHRSDNPGILLAKISHLLPLFSSNCHQHHQTHTTSHNSCCIVLLIIMVEIVNIYWGLLCAKHFTKCFTNQSLKPATEVDTVSTLTTDEETEA